MHFIVNLQQYEFCRFIFKYIFTENEKKNSKYELEQIGLSIRIDLVFHWQ